jgi:hypothetical protein
MFLIISEIYLFLFRTHVIVMNLILKDLSPLLHLGREAKRKSYV